MLTKVLNSEGEVGIGSGRIPRPLDGGWHCYYLSIHKFILICSTEGKLGEGALKSDFNALLEAPSSQCAKNFNERYIFARRSAPTFLNEPLK